MNQGRSDDPEVTIALVDDEYIQDLNFRFRQINKPTDVLSFPLEEDAEDEDFIDGGDDNILGDIIISVEMAQRQAEEFGHSFVREMAYLAVHGMFHLLGYDHHTDEDRQLMRGREEEVLSQLEIMR